MNYIYQRALSLVSATLLFAAAACGGAPGIEKHITSPMSQQSAAKGQAIPVWQSFPVPIYVDSLFSIGDKAAITSAMATWEKALGQKVFNLLSPSDGVHSHASGIFRDSNTSAFGTSADYGTIYAFTSPRSDFKSGYLVTASIYFNASSFNWGDTLSLDYSLPPADTQSIALHELGHFLGLEHTNAAAEPESIMNPTIPSEEGYAKRRLSLLDIERVQKLYGINASEASLESIYDTQTQVDSTSDSDVEAVQLRNDCKDLFAKHGPIVAGIYDFSKSLPGVTLSQHFDCSNFPENVRPASN